MSPRRNRTEQPTSLLKMQDRTCPAAHSAAPVDSRLAATEVALDWDHFLDNMPSLLQSEESTESCDDIGLEPLW